MKQTIMKMLINYILRPWCIEKSIFWPFSAKIMAVLADFIMIFFGTVWPTNLSQKIPTFGRKGNWLHTFPTPWPWKKVVKKR